ncbi:MAG: EamA family transporter, partial [Halobacterium sp.]
MPETLVGVGFAALAAVAITVQSLAVRLASGRRSVAEIAAVIFALNLLVLVPVAAVAEYPHYGVTPAALAAFATAGLLGSLVARLCYFVGIARIGASRTEPLKALFPVVAVAGAVLVLGESVTAHLLAGLALVLAGTTAVVLEARDSPVTPTGRRLRTDVLFPL